MKEQTWKPTHLKGEAGNEEVTGVFTGIFDSVTEDMADTTPPDDETTKPRIMEPDSSDFPMKKGDVPAHDRETRAHTAISEDDIPTNPHINLPETPFGSGAGIFRRHKKTP